MTTGPLAVVTGAYGYSGKRIARRLLDRGYAVRTLTNRMPAEDPFGGRVERHPLDFDRLEGPLEGAEILVNTYWVRFNHKNFTHEQAVANTRKLFEAARRAGVGRVVHVSITKPSVDSRFEYFRGKARLEQALAGSGLPHSILRPAVLFGGEDILVNNIAWALRRFPVFGVFGDGEYGLRPIHVDDLADLAVREAEASGNRTIDAVGPESFTYRGLAAAVGEIIGKPRRIVSVRPCLGYAVARVVGFFVNDVMLTREEIGGLMAGLLESDAEPAGPTLLTAYAREHAETLGRSYASELARRR